MPGEIARGREAIHAAQEAAKSGGNFSPYLKSIYWGDDKEEHYVLFLNEVDEMPSFDMVQFLEDENGHYQEVVAKTDQFFGERKDAFVEDWDATIVKRTLAIAVELEPVIEVVKGRKKPTGFEVKTTEYKRKVLDDDGEVTDEEEEVTAPVVGYVVQSPNNFFNHVENYDANEAPITEAAVKITRLGKDKHTSYALQGYDDQPIDLGNLIEYIDGVSYLRDEADDLLKQIAKSSDQEAAGIIGQALLDKKIEELLDEDRYDAILEHVAEVGETLDRFGNKKKKKGKSSEKGDRARNRVAERRTTRRERVTEEETNEPDATPDETEVDETEVEEQPKAKRRTRSTKAAKTSGGNEAAGSRMSDLRSLAAEKQAKRKAA